MTFKNAFCGGTGCKSSERKYKCLVCFKKHCSNCGIKYICKDCIAFLLRQELSNIELTKNIMEQSNIHLSNSDYINIPNNNFNMQNAKNN